MTIEERKIDLISWLSNLDNENLLSRIEELKQGFHEKLPKEIVSLLDTSNSTDLSELVEHTNSRDLLSRK